MDLLIQGVPIAKKRPRFFRRGSFVGTYNDQVTEEGRWQLQAQGQITEQIQGPIELIIDFGMPLPKSSPKKVIKAVSDFKIIPHVKKPDLDNLLKFVKDCLNGLAWKDDSQVCEVKARKFYVKTPNTWIRIREKL